MIFEKRKPVAGGPSQYRGVIWHKSNGKWEARIYEAGKQRFLGYFTSELAAAEAYDSRAVLLHGSNAKVNFPQNHEATRNNAPASKLMPRKLTGRSIAEKPRPPMRRKRAVWEGEDSEEESVDLSDDEGDSFSPDYPINGKHSPSRTQSPDVISDAESDQTRDPKVAKVLESGAIEVLANLRQTSRQSSPDSAVTTGSCGLKNESLPASERTQKATVLAAPRRPGRASAEEMKNLYEWTKLPSRGLPGHGGGQQEFGYKEIPIDKDISTDVQDKGPISWDTLSQKCSQHSASAEEQVKDFEHPSMNFTPETWRPDLWQQSQAGSPSRLKPQAGHHQEALLVPQASPFAFNKSLSDSGTPTWVPSQVQCDKSSDLEAFTTGRSFSRGLKDNSNTISKPGISRARCEISTSNGTQHNLQKVAATQAVTASAKGTARSPTPHSIQENGWRSDVEVEGVHWKPLQKRWQASVRAGSTIIDLGSFQIQHEATIAFQTASKVLSIQQGTCGGASQVTDIQSSGRTHTEKATPMGSKTLPPVERTASHSIEPTGKVLEACNAERKCRNLYAGPLPKRQRAF